MMVQKPACPPAQQRKPNFFGLVDATLCPAKISFCDWKTLFLVYLFSCLAFCYNYNYKIQIKKKEKNCKFSHSTHFLLNSLFSIMLPRLLAARLQVLLGQVILQNGCCCIVFLYSLCPRSLHFIVGPSCEGTPFRMITTAIFFYKKKNKLFLGFIEGESQKLQLRRRRQRRWWCQENDTAILCHLIIPFS